MKSIYFKIYEKQNLYQFDQNQTDINILSMCFENTYSKNTIARKKKFRKEKTILIHLPLLTIFSLIFTL